MSKPIITAEFAESDSPFAVAYQRRVGYVVVERDTLTVRAEFDRDGAGHEAARELANELNLEHAAELADSAVALAEMREPVTVGTIVRVTSPTAPDFQLSGTVAAVHYTDYPSYLVSFGPYFRPYGRGEIETVTVWPPVEAESDSAATTFAAEWDAMVEASRLMADLNRCAAALTRCIVEGRPGLTHVLSLAHDDLSDRIRALGWEIGPASDGTGEYQLLPAESTLNVIVAPEARASEASCLWRFSGTASALRRYLDGTKGVA